MNVIAAILATAVAASFAKSSDLALQISLEREGFSCNTVDGSWGPKSARALSRWIESNTAGEPNPVSPDGRAALYNRHFKGGEPLYRFVRVTKADLSSLVSIPPGAADRANLPRMGYESIKEMMAERGHLSQRAIERLNPRIDWTKIKAGDVVKIPNMPSMQDDLASWPRNGDTASARPEASLVRISLSRCEITAWDANGNMLASFPCSIARDKANLPKQGELKIVTAIANPNYTYTPDRRAGARGGRHVWPAGPNCPVGVAWMGLNLPGYGIHGTPNPESIGSAESHGCFRLANWNAARLYSMVKPGVKVSIEK